MRIIISPAKKMNIDEYASRSYDLPVFLKDTKKLMNYIKTLDFEQAKSLWKTNDKITHQNIKRFEDMRLEKSLTPAIFSYEGIQYQSLSALTLDDDMLCYIQNNLRILSGFYGVLRPMDAVVPYRLEMQAIVDINDTKSLYDFWGKKIYNEIIDDSNIIINLASKEYSKCVEPYLKKKDVYITCTFKEYDKEKPVQKATYAKMARGAMVRYMAENNIQNIEDIKNFNTYGYKYEEKLSSKKEFIFVKS